MMFAKIMQNDLVYYSPIFAVSEKRSEVVAFDSSFSRLEVFNIYKLAEYTTIFLNYDSRGFAIDDGNFKSYWNDKHIFRNVKRRKYTVEMLEEAKEVLSKLIPTEFTEIKNSDDLKALLFTAGTFHDAYILGAHKSGDALEMLFDSCWGAIILFRFADIVENSLEVGDCFFHGEARIDDGVVEFSFGNKKLLRAGRVEFKPFFKRKIDIDMFDKVFLDEMLLMKSKDGDRQIEFDLNKTKIFDFKEGRVIGYFDCHDDGFCFLCSEECAYYFGGYESNAKKRRKVLNQKNELKEKCEEKGFYFEKFPFLYEDN